MDNNSFSLVTSLTHLDRPSTTTASRMGVRGSFAHLWPSSSISTKPFTSLSSGLPLLPANSTNSIRRLHKLPVPTSLSQLARCRNDLGQRGSSLPIRISPITLSRLSPAAIPSIRATLPPRVSLMSSSVSSRMFPRCVSGYSTINFFSVILTGTSSRHTVPPTLSLLPPVARPCCREVCWPMEQHLEEPDHRHREQSRSCYSLPRCLSPRWVVG